MLDEKNVHAQCRDCNGKQNWEGVDTRYTKYLITKYGIEILDYFNKKKNEICKRSNSEWQMIANYWEATLKEIKKEKGYEI